MDELLNAVRGVGRWLSRFQSLAPEDAAPLLDLNETVDYVDLRLQQLVDASAITSDERRAVRARIEELWQEIPEHHRRTVPIHADYCLGNVLVDRGRVIVLDFAMTRRGAVYHDLAHMYLQMQMMQAKPWFRPAMVNGLCDALLEGYAPGTRSDEPLFRTLMIHHVVNHLTKLTIRPPRRQLARPFNWLIRRQHLAWLRESGCFDVRRSA